MQRSPRRNTVSWFTPIRIDERELLDSGIGSPGDVAANLAEMWRINRDLGGFQALTKHLYSRLLANPTSTILDLGTGGAEALANMARWARKCQLRVRFIGVDLSARNLKVARSSVADFPEITLVQSDANSLSYPPDSVDFIISSLFLHHCSPEQITELLASAYRCSRRAIIMTDLVRSWPHLFAFQLVQPVFARSYLTRHDGVLSIRRAYTPAELLNMAQVAGIPEPRVHVHWPWRMTLVAEK
jgi:ubiquinone/menaquinone biosynthesis C-methylase UbiE